MAQHYYSKDPVSASNERSIDYVININGYDQRYSFITDSGVFSISRVDHGTDILLNAILKDEPEAPNRLLDIGCGYGPIGAVMGTAFPMAHVHMVDVNERAMDLARRNAQKAKLKDFTVETVDNLPALLQDPANAFQMVVTNPPIRAGKAVVYGIFQQAFDHLSAGGALYVVIRKNQGGPSAIKELERLFGNCEIIDREAGFHILKSIKE